MENNTATLSHSEVVSESDFAEKIAHYTSEPYDVFGDPGEDGEQVIVEKTCVIDVAIRGNDAIGYVLYTSDDADGPSDDLGDTVYPTREAAMEALKAAMKERKGWFD
jgi:hypothetical protein